MNIWEEEENKKKKTFTSTPKDSKTAVKGKFVISQKAFYLFCRLQKYSEEKASEKKTQSLIFFFNSILFSPSLLSNQTTLIFANQFHIKRSATDSDLDGDAHNETHKKMKSTEEEDSEIGFSNLDENLVYEVLKHVDAKTLAMSSCVSKIWHKTAQDERLWELICTRHWTNIGCGQNQLRSVVLALGGFRRLHSLYLWPLSKPNPRARFGKDELKLTLSLLSIRYYEKMSFTKRPLPNSN